MEEAWSPDFATIRLICSIRDKIYSHFSLTMERRTINDKCKKLQGRNQRQSIAKLIVPRESYFCEKIKCKDFLRILKY